MPWHLDTLPLARAAGDAPLALAPLARWLHAHRPGPAPDDLARVLVLLPASRTCADLAQALVATAPGPAVLLPQILTPGALAAHLAALQGQSADDLPPAALRSLLLAPALAQLPWLVDRPEAAPGLAAEFVALFDEVRLGRCDALILAGADDPRLFAGVDPAAAEVLQRDLARIRQAWACYRAAVPRDRIDAQIAALAAAAERWPGPEPDLVAVAHVGRLDRACGELLGCLARRGVPVHLLVPDAGDPRSRLLLATYRDAGGLGPGAGPEASLANGANRPLAGWSPAHPLAGIRRLADRLGAPAPPPVRFAGASLAERLQELGPERGALGPGGDLELVACREPEHESRVIAERVTAALAAAAPPPQILVATGDRDLAARVVAQLRDAGVDADDTRGRPLRGLPAGRLLADLLRTAVAGWPYGPLFELLGHPYVRLVEAGARPGHAVRVQLLEAAVRRAGRARRGLPALRQIAAQDDAAAGPGRAGWRLADLVTTAAAALAPLTALGAQPRPWPEALAAVRHAWRLLAPDRPLDDPGLEPAGDFDDVGGLAGLLDGLEDLAPSLPPASLPEIAAAVRQLLAATEVRPHRQRHLPVVVTGLVEARLAAADLLVLGGLSQDVFPGSLPRPLLLDARVRAALGLDHWRDRAGRDAELFLRLLHAAPRVVMTWPEERDGQPSLPSPLVQRLLLVAPGEPARADEVVLRRRERPDPGPLAAAEARFRAEPEPVPAPAAPRPDRLSHTALQRYRECPYRFLLADALGLRRPDPLEPVFAAPDAGNLAHLVMQTWLAPEGAAVAALAAGDESRALTALAGAADAAFAALGKDLPGGAVVLRALLGLGPALVAAERERIASWRPAATEAGFRVTLGQAADWLGRHSGQAPAVPAARRDFPLIGRIDRLDAARDGAPRVQVLDYKTGSPPARKRSLEGRALQVALYGLALEAGEVDGLPAPTGGWELAAAGYYVLRGPQPGPAWHLESRADLAAPVARILEQALSALDPDVPFALVPDWQDPETPGALPCATCDFAGVCRLQERDTTEALAVRVTRMITSGRGGAA